MPTEYPTNPLTGFAVRAERMSDGIRQAWEDYGLEALDQWMSFRFIDGSTDARLYANKSEAMRFQKREEECCYLPLPPSMGVKECDAYLRVHEQLYDAGLRIADPDKPVHVEPHQRMEEWNNQGLIIPTFSSKRKNRR